MTDPDERRANRRGNTPQRPPLPPLLLNGARPSAPHVPIVAPNDDPFAMNIEERPLPQLNIPVTHIPDGWDAPLRNPIPQNVPPPPPAFGMRRPRNRAPVVPLLHEPIAGPSREHHPPAVPLPHEP
ncbi:hypothetical protein H0H93_014931, partial [Arthromyces matolae]